MEYKTVPLEIKADGDTGIVEGHYSVFGNKDDGGDISHQGSFTKTIQERGGRVMVFRFHDWRSPIGPAGGGFNDGAGNVLKEDGQGLFARYKLSLESIWGKDTWALIKDQVVKEGSYGYEAVKFDFGEKGVRNLREQKLFEISPVPLGMNPLTGIQAAKGGNNPLALELLAASLEAIRDGKLLASAEKQQTGRLIGALEGALESLRAAAEPDKGQRELALHSTLLANRLRAAELALVRIKYSHGR
jgi:HK97 family phage prohead protease